MGVKGCVGGFEGVEVVFDRHFGGEEVVFFRDVVAVLGAVEAA